MCLWLERVFKGITGTILTLLIWVSSSLVRVCSTVLEELLD